MKLFVKILIALGVLFLLALLLLVSGMFYLAHRISGEGSGGAMLMKEVHSLQRDGIAIDPAAIQRPLPPPDQNAAPLYTQLTADLQRQPLTAEDKAALRSLTYDAFPNADEEAILRRLVAERSGLLDLVHLAAHRPHCVFQRDWALGEALPLPEYAPMRFGVELLGAESYLQAREGRFAAATRTQALGFRVAEHVGSDPNVIAYLVDGSCDSISLAGMKRILWLGGRRRGVAAAVEAAVSGGRPQLSLRWALQGEIIDSLARRRTITSEPARRNPAAFPVIPGYAAAPTAPDETGNFGWIPGLGPALASRATDGGIARILAAEHQMIRDSGLPLLQRRQAIQEIYAPIMEQAKDAPQRLDPSYILPGALLPVIAQLDIREMMARTQEHVVMASAAVLDYRARRGRYPRQLSDVISLQDPLTGGPLAYSASGGGFTVDGVGLQQLPGVTASILRSYPEPAFSFPAS